MDSAAAGCSDADDMEAKRLLICGRCRCEEVKNFRRRFIQAACRDGIALKYIADFLSVSHETVRRRVPGTSTKFFISLL
jgi:hypothetical protein